MVRGLGQKGPFSCAARFCLWAGDSLSPLRQGLLYSVKIPAEIGAEQTNAGRGEMHARAQYVGGAKSRQRVLGYTQSGLHLTSGKGKSHVFR